MARQTQKADPVAQAKKDGLVHISEAYDIPGRGKVCVATDQYFGENYEAFAEYVNKHRHDRSRVRFIKLEAGHTYGSTKEQDTIAWEIGRQEEVSVGPPPASFREEKERAERVAEAPGRREAETEAFFVRYGGNPVRIEVDLTQMSRQDKENLQSDKEAMGRRPSEHDFFDFIERYHSYIDNITVEVTERGGKRRVQVGMGNAAETFSDIDRLSRRA